MARYQTEQIQNLWYGLNPFLGVAAGFHACFDITRQDSYFADIMGDLNLH